MTTPWAWNAKARRWQGSAGTKYAGQFISPAKLKDLRDTFIQGQLGAVDLLGQRLAEGEITIQGWERDMRAHLKTVYQAEYLLARGGAQAMTPSDYGRLGGLLRWQYQYLHDIAADIQAGRLSEQALIARAQLYVHSATQAHEQGKAAAWGLRVPHVPGDGSTLCKVNCKCYLEIREDDEAWHVYWRRTADESCDTCVERSQTWNPLDIAKPLARNRRALRRLLVGVTGQPVRLHASRR